jgi:hypothetical protein
LWLRPQHHRITGLGGALTGVPVLLGACGEKPGLVSRMLPPGMTGCFLFGGEAAPLNDIAKSTQAE